MLVLAGTGVHDAKDMSLKALEVVAEADSVYVEMYTSIPASSLREIEGVVGRKVKVLERSDLEENSRKIIEEARRKKVVILVPGDPMVATTHSALRLEAEKAGVETEVVHGSSISSAVCITGLQFYRFGKTATVSYPAGSRVSTYPVDVVRQNWGINAHTLLLLDLNPRPMRVGEAVDLLFQAGMENWFGVAIADVGGKNEMMCDRLDRLRSFESEGLHSLIILARTLHFMEFECLKAFANAPDELEEIVE